jgi:hypothetical protein
LKTGFLRIFFWRFIEVKRIIPSNMLDQFCIQSWYRKSHSTLFSFHISSRRQWWPCVIGTSYSTDTGTSDESRLPKAAFQQTTMMTMCHRNVIQYRYRNIRWKSTTQGCFPADDNDDHVSSERHTVQIQEHQMKVDYPRLLQV